MKILIIQHSAGDRPAVFESVVRSLGHSVEIVRADLAQSDLRRPDLDGSIPKQVDADMLATFGGAFSLARDQPPAWVAHERALIRQYVAAGHRVLGVCLGAQLVASALGAPVRRNRTPEVGWHRIEQTPSHGSRLIQEQFPEQPTVLHWHRDTFGIPPGSSLIFKSQACDHQAFAIGDQVFGFQFHLEADEQTVRIFSAVAGIHRSLNAPVPSVQSIAAIQQATPRHLPQQMAMFDGFLRAWLRD